MFPSTIKRSLLSPARTILILLLFASLLLSHTLIVAVEAKKANGDDADWRWCVSNIARFYIPQPDFKRIHKRQPTPMIWTEEGQRLCGFKMISMTTLQQEAFFVSGDDNINDNDDSDSTMISSRHTFVGDSTSLRAYATAVNDFFPENTRLDVGKVSQSPPYMSTRAKEDKFPSIADYHQSNNNKRNKKKKKVKSVEMRFTKFIHMSQWNDSLRMTFLPMSDDQAASSVVKSSSNDNVAVENDNTNEQISSNSNNNNNIYKQPPPSARALGTFFNRGMVSFSLGNWDLNWKLQPTYKIPGLYGRKRLINVMNYWSYNAQQLFNWLDENILVHNFMNSDNNNKGMPLIIIKEQLLPKCDASRFEPKRIGKKLFHKKCKELLKPVVIPMYRRVLAALAWSRNIPVVPVDFLVQLGPTVCMMGDGIHLDAACMPHEQQLLWNVYLLMRRKNVKQRRFMSRREGGGGDGEIDRIVGTPSTSSSLEEDLKKFLGEKYFKKEGKKMMLNATEALNHIHYAQWYCTKPWRTEDSLFGNTTKDDEYYSQNNICKGVTIDDTGVNMKSYQPSSNNNNNNNNNVDDENDSSSTPSQLSPSTTGTIKGESLRKLINNEKKKSSSDKNNNDDDENNDDSSSTKQLKDYYFNRNTDNSLRVTDVFTVLLIVLVPIVAYLGLRSLGK